MPTRLRNTVGFILCLCVSTEAAEPTPFIYPVSTYRVVDGDTIAVTLDLGFGIQYSTSVRLAGLNAPEITGRERPAGLMVATRVQRWMEQHPQIFVQYVAEDAYAGRIVGTVLTPSGESLNTWLLQTGQAIPYDGKSKSPAFTIDQITALSPPGDN